MKVLHYLLITLLVSCSVPKSTEINVERLIIGEWWGADHDGSMITFIFYPNKNVDLITKKQEIKNDALCFGQSIKWEIDNRIKPFKLIIIVSNQSEIKKLPFYIDFISTEKILISLNNSLGEKAKNLKKSDRNYKIALFKKTKHQSSPTISLKDIKQEDNFTQQAENIVKLSSAVVKIQMLKNFDQAYLVSKKGNISEGNYAHTLLVIDIKDKKILKETEFAGSIRDNTISFGNGKLSYILTENWLNTDLKYVETTPFTLGVHTYNSILKLNGLDIRAFDKSPNGSKGAILGGDGKVYLWDLKKPQLLWTSDNKITLPNYNNKGIVKFSDDGSIIVASTRLCNRILLLNADDGQLISTIPLSQGPISSLAISSDNSFVAYSEKKNSIVVTRTDNTESKYFQNLGIIEHLKLTNNNRCILFADSNGIVSIMDIITGKLISKVHANKGWVNHLDISGDNTYGVSVGPENDVTKWIIPSLCWDHLDPDLNKESVLRLFLDD